MQSKTSSQPHRPFSVKGVVTTLEGFANTEMRSMLPLSTRISRNRDHLARMRKLSDILQRALDLIDESDVNDDMYRDNDVSVDL
jgi:hypothetical protein